MAVPKVFDGNGKGFNPKDLLTAFIASCYVTMLAIMLQSRKIPGSDISVTSDLTDIKPSGIHIKISFDIENYCTLRFFYTSEL